MITCQLQGGLGNQMFQIAATYALAKRNNDEYSFNFNTCHTPLQGNTSKKYKDNIFKNIKEDVNFIPKFIFSEEKFSYNELPYTNNLSLTGYFQSEKYFIDYKEEIKKLFHISSENIKLIRDFFIWWDLLDKQITSIHVRRGDYLNNQEFHKICPIEYYEKTMEEIGDSYFIFISDDMDWVKKKFIGKNIVYSSFNDEILDLSMMMLCDNNIIANSSFSWWGAYLNKNENKKIIAPKIWFGPNGPKDTQDLIPKDWKLM